MNTLNLPPVVWAAYPQSGWKVQSLFSKVSDLIFSIYSDFISVIIDTLTVPQTFLPTAHCLRV